MLRSASLGLLIIPLAACSQNAPVTAEVENAAHKAVDLEYELRGPRNFNETWYEMASPSIGAVCGTFKPQPIEEIYGAERRYMFDVKFGLLIDPIPELQIASSAATQSLIYETDRLFDDTWTKACEPYRPTFFNKLLGG